MRYFIYFLLLPMLFCTCQKEIYTYKTVVEIGVVPQDQQVKLYFNYYQQSPWGPDIVFGGERTPIEGRHYTLYQSTSPTAPMTKVAEGINTDYDIPFYWMDQNHIIYPTWNTRGDSFMKLKIR